MNNPSAEEWIEACESALKQLDTPAMKQRDVILVGDQPPELIENFTKRLEDQGRVIVLGGGRMGGLGLGLAMERLAKEAQLLRPMDLNLLNEYTRPSLVMKEADEDRVNVSGKMLALLQRGVPALRETKLTTEDQQG